MYINCIKDSKSIVKYKMKIIIFSFIFLCAAIIISFFTGSFGITFKKTMLWLAGMGEMSPNEKFILLEVRLPRIIMAVITGAALAGSGVSMQAVFKNPLVSPFVLGISSGASLGAALAIVYFNSSALMIEALSFTFAIGAFMAAYLLSRSGGGTTLLLLFGIAVSSLCQSLIGLMQYFADTDHQLPALTFWMLGGLDSISFSSLTYALPVCVISLAILYTQSYKMNILTLSDAEAASLGVDTARIKFVIIFLSALVTAACTSKTGVIGWIGLTIPHISRIILGPDNRFVFIFAASAGAIFLLVSDSLIRFINIGELPVGIITSAIGAPFFAFILLKYKNSGWK